VTTFLRTGDVYIRRAIGRLRTWFDPPIDSGARPLEIREAVIDGIERRAEPAAAGRRVLPHNYVLVSVLADKDDRAALGAAFDDLDATIRGRLAELRCPVPPGFAVDVHYLKKPKSGWRPTQRFSLDFESRVVSQPSPAPGPAAPGLRVEVIRGASAQATYQFDDTHIRIGRSASPTDHTGRPRHNHIVFMEEGDEHSATVGRAHASIHYDPDKREYRLFDDGSHNGTRIVRRGTVMTVAARNPVGTTVLTDDELQFGTAAVKIAIGTRERTSYPPSESRDSSS
jgi:hypothetical protein